MITGQQTKVVYLANGTQTEFPLPFFFFDQGDVVVSTVDQYSVEAQITTGYAVAGAQDEDGGMVTFAAPPAAGLKLVLRRRTARKQETRYPEGGKFPSRTVETDFDKLVAIAQELTEEVGRCVQTPPDDSIDRNDLVQELLAARGAAAASAEEAEASAVAAANSAAVAQGQADRAEGEADAAAAAAAQGVADMDAIRQAGLGALAGAGVPVGAEFMWFADPADPTGDIPAGYVLGMGEELSRATFADLWAFAEGTGRVISEAAWQAAYAANNGNVGFYSSGNGSTTFRAPRIVRHVSGGEIAESGAYVADALKAHNHVSGLSFNNGAAGVVKFGITDTGVSSSQKDADGQETLTTTYGANTSTVGGAENLVRAIKRTVIIKAFSAAVNTGGVDVEQLATDVSALASRLEAVGTPVKTSVYKTSTYYQNLVANIIGDAGDVLPTEGVEVAAVSHTMRYANSKLIVQFSAFVQAVSVGVNGMLVDNGGLVNAERVAGTGTTQVQILRAVIDNGGPAGTVHSISARLGRDSVAGSFNVGNFATATFGLNQHQIVLTVEEVHA